jgi:hypothetical protein
VFIGLVAALIALLNVSRLVCVMEQPQCVWIRPALLRCVLNLGSMRQALLQLIIFALHWIALCTLGASIGPKMTNVAQARPLLCSASACSCLF